MMTSEEKMQSADTTDAELVSHSLAGDREAFGHIVSRYQTLVCSIAYSGTGSLTQSEDLAQEAFISAWKQLASLREPKKLRSWLCTIVRNLTWDALKKQGREPSHAAQSLDELHESPAPEPQPHDLTISNEEAAILRRSLEKIPEIYREPLVLFYREHQSIEAVAASLELTEDAVKQRLSRGRKLLQEQVLAFVEGALSRTNPGKVFTIGVLAALPALTLSAKAATLGATAAKGSAAAKTAGAMGLLAVIFSPLLILSGNYAGYRIGMAEAKSDEERGYIKAFFKKAMVATVALFVPYAAAVIWVCRNQGNHEYLAVSLFIGFIVFYLLAVLVCGIISHSRQRRYYSKMLATDHSGVFPKAAFEYRSKMEFLGLPLVHVRIGDRFDVLRKPVTAWIAMGNYAIGGLVAFGGMAIAPVSIGFMAIGLLPLGGLAFGPVANGGFALGYWAFGGVAIGWQAVGCFAVAWNAAVGNFALAHDFALGPISRAIEHNTEIASQFINSSLFFRVGTAINHHSLLVNLLWVTPLMIQWRIMARKKKSESVNQ